MILLVEDDEDVRELLEVALQGRGYVIESVTNGDAALAVLEHQRPCLIILDMIMPGTTGWEVLKQMKVRGIADIPVCVISALSDPPPGGVIAALTKPFDVSLLVALAKQYCGHVSTPAQARG